MSLTYISVELRRLVVARAERLCEYCLMAEDDTFFGCEVDHIISEKHGGPTEGNNLAQACVFCNQAKGSDIGSIYWETGELLRFFNPRSDNWFDHFVLSGARIEPRRVANTLDQKAMYLTGKTGHALPLGGTPSSTRPAWPRPPSCTAFARTWKPASASTRAKWRRRITATSWPS